MADTARAAPSAAKATSRVLRASGLGKRRRVMRVTNASVPSDPSKQPGQVIADHVLHGPAAGVDGARGRHHLQPERVVAGDAVLDAARSAGALGDVATERADSLEAGSGGVDGPSRSTSLLQPGVPPRLPRAAVRLSASSSRMRFMRVSTSTMPPLMHEPVKPLPAPRAVGCGVRGPAAPPRLTWSVVVACTTTSGRKRAWVASKASRCRRRCPRRRCPRRRWPPGPARSVQ